MRRLRIFISHPSHFLTDCEPSGDGLLAQEYIRRLGERGHELHVAVPAMKLERPFAPSVHLYPVRSLTRVSTSRPSWQQRMEYAVRVRHLLRRLQKEVRFDLIHQLNPVVLGMSSLLSGCGLPIVLGPLPAPGRLPLPSSPGRKLNRWVLHRQIQQAARVLIPNAASLPLIPDDLESQSKVRELPFGVDTVRFAPSGSVSNQQAQKKSVLFLANLNERKGPFHLLESFERVAEKHPDFLLQFAGDGEVASALRLRVAASPFAERIHFLGRIARDRVPEVLQACTVYCLPSAYEAFGMTALEAMSCGKPVIGTQVGGLGLLVQETSPHVEPANVGQLAEALDALMSSEDLCDQLGARNRDIAVQHYAWTKVISRLESLYQDLLLQGKDASSAPGAELVGQR